MKSEFRETKIVEKRHLASHPLGTEEIIRVTEIANGKMYFRDLVWFEESGEMHISSSSVFIPNP